MKTNSTGYTIGVAATIIALVWIGILKFTPMEAMMIKPYVENSFLLSWMYKVMSVGMASMMIGVFEIITGLLLLVSFWSAKAGRIGGILGIIIFLTTLSFLFTTPMAWKIAEGVPVTDFFVFKDLAYLGISVQVLERARA